MKPESRDDDHRGYDKAWLLKTGGLAVALGTATWLLGPLLLPIELPKDFPRLPDLRTVQPDLRALLQNADRDARRKPGSAEAIGKLAMAYHANLFVEQAARGYRIAARLAPGDYQWVYYQAILEEENGNEVEQLKLLQQTLRLKSDHALARLKLADWSFKHDRLDEAALYYEMAAGVPGKTVHLQATFGLGRVAARRQDWKKVIEYIAPLSHENPALWPLYDLLQVAYGALGQTDKAAEAGEGVVVAKLKVVPPPEDPLNEQLTGLCYSSTRLLKQAGLLSRIGQPDRAIQVARRAASVDPTDPDVRNFIAQTLLASCGDKPEAIEEALTELGECLRLRPDDLMPLWTFTSDFFMTPRKGAAVERLHALLLPHANSADAHLSLGLVAEARGETAEAVSQYQAALKHNPNDSIAHNQLGQLFDRAGNYGEAVAHFQRSVQLSPLNARLRRNFGIALIQEGKYGQGVKEFGEVLRLNPYDVPALTGMGFALLNLKRIDEAIPRFLAALPTEFPRRPLWPGIRIFCAGQAGRRGDRTAGGAETASGLSGSAGTASSAGSVNRKFPQFTGRSSIARFGATATRSLLCLARVRRRLDSAGAMCYKRRNHEPGIAPGFHRRRHGDRGEYLSASPCAQLRQLHSIQPEA